MEIICDWITKEMIQAIILKKGNGRCDKVIFEMPEIKLKDVDCSYNGKPGCMCGCLGNYAYLKSNQKSASKSRGYKVEDSEISERAVNFIINKLKKEEQRGIEVIGNYIYVLDIKDRRYALYLKKQDNN